MKLILMILSYLGLALTLLPSFFVFFNAIEFSTHTQLMLAGTILWFVTAPFWIGKEKTQ